MRITKECVPCLINRIRFEIDQVDPGLKGEVIPNITKILEDAYASGSNSAFAATRVHDVAYRALGCDPYAELKRRSTEVARSMLPKADAFIECSKDKFGAKVLVSIVGNALDFGIAGGSSSPEALKGEFDALLSSEFMDQSKDLRDRAEKRGKVLFMADNCGEIVLDRYLLEELSSLAEVNIMAKDVPILTDATVQDVKDADLDKYAKKVLGSGPFAVGFDPERLPDEVKRLMKGSLIVSKGMANYEVLSDARRPIEAYLLMRVKCAPVAASLGVKKGLNICMRYDTKMT